MAHVTLHLWRVPPSRVVSALLRMGTDRWWLRRTPGLRFAKLLGTGRGRTFDVRDADPRTWGLLCAWEDVDASIAFEGHRTPRGWRRIAEQEWRGDLACLRTTGRWSGQTPFEVDEVLLARGPAPEQMIASLTRARLRPRRMLRFWRAVPSVVADLDAVAAGPVLRVGIGEAPIGLQGTFTLWPDEQALIQFAYRRPAHRRAIRDTERLNWYAEELFARFAVVAQRGAIFDHTART